MDSSQPSHSSGYFTPASSSDGTMAYDVFDQLYEYTISLDDTKSKEAVWVSSAHPSLLSLKLRDIQETVKTSGCMDALSMNLAIRKMSREESNDGNSKDCEFLGQKHYVSTDFARYAISEEDGYCKLRTCMRNELLDPRDASSSGVLCIPVDHGGHWTLYAFNLDDEKLSILDPLGADHKHHDSIRLKVCNALQFVKSKISLFKEKSTDFSSWKYEFAEAKQGNNRNDSGFFVLNFMRHWDGQRLAQSFIPSESSRELRKNFLAHILTFKDNESYELPTRVRELIKILSAGSAQKRCLMDEGLLKVVREGDAEKFLPQTIGMFLRGVTSDGDGVLHVACRFGHVHLVRKIFSLIAHADEEQPVETGPLAEFLRARNHNGETCLHEAVRWGHTQLVKLLVEEDARFQDKIDSPALVQIVDCKGVSPLYLAVTLRRADIVHEIIETKQDSKYVALSYAGPAGQTALHAAVLLNQELTGLLISKNAYLLFIADKSGCTPLHYLASIGGGATAKLLLDSKDAETKMQEEIVRRQDSKGWLPIHVAAANGRLDVIREIHRARPDSMSSCNASGQSFLHVAVANTKHNVVEYVCKQQNLGGILNLRDRDGNTALHLAVKTGDQSVFCSLMRNKGVCLSLANKDGRTPLDLAKLCYEPGLKMIQNSQISIYYHLRVAGADFGICRRDDLNAERVGNIDRGKLSETMSTSAAVVAGCAVFMLDIANTTFVQVASQFITPSDANSAAAAAAIATAEAGSKAQRARAHAFKALIFFNALAFSSSMLAAFCGTFAGFPVMDIPTRFGYLWAGGLAIQVASLAVVAVFVLAAYLAFALVTLRIAAFACIIPLVAIAPQSSPLLVLLRHGWTLFHRFVLFDTKVYFREHVLPKARPLLEKLQSHLPSRKRFSAIVKKIPKCLSSLIHGPIAVCAVVATAPIWIALVIAVAILAIFGIIILVVVFIFINPAAP